MSRLPQYLATRSNTASSSPGFDTSSGTKMGASSLRASGYIGDQLGVNVLGSGR